MKKDKTKKINDVVIVGAGPVGIYAAFYAGLRGLNGCLLEASANVGGQAKLLFGDKDVLDFPGLYLSNGDGLIKNLFQQYSRFKEQIKLHLNTKVLSIKKTTDGTFDIETNQKTIKAKTICLAVGPGAIEPIKLKLDTKNFDVNYMIDDIKNFYKKNVVIFGGGNSAVDWANMLKENANVTIIHRRNEFRANNSEVKKLTPKVKILKPYKLKSLSKDIIELVHSKTKENLQIKYQKIIVQYGLKSAFGEIRNWGFNWESGRIKVDPWKKTNIKGVWAIGNSCYYEGKNYIITTGLGDAIVALASIHNYLNPKSSNTIYSTDYK